YKKSMRTTIPFRDFINSFKIRFIAKLLVCSLGKLKHGSINAQLYNESAITLEKLSILKPLAEVYVTEMAQEEYLQSKRVDRRWVNTMT
ncbi:hypothetical protein OESDEN_15075, partial [Oesophagostomum dentatum]